MSTTRHHIKPWPIMILALAVLTCAAHADQITLKDGTTVSGKITIRSKKLIYIKVDGKTQKIPVENIDKIVDEESKPTAQSAEAPKGPDLAPILEPIRTRHDLPAMAAAVIVDGKTESVSAVGVRKIDANTKVTGNDKFHLGSCTKAITATLLAILVDEGKITWDATLPEIFPELANDMHPDYASVTLRHLLNHRAGLPADSAPKGMTLLDVHQLPGSPQRQRTEYIKRMLAIPPEAPPGTKYIYSNAGFAVAGAIAEKVTKSSWERLMQKHIFKPLGMTSAGFGAMGRPGKLDQPLQHRPDGDRSVPVEPGPLADNPPAIGPAGTVHCAIGDWAKFVAEHLTQPGATGQLLAGDTYRTLHTAPFDGEYAYGWLTTQRDWGGGDVLTHSGSNTMNFCTVWLAPQRRFAVLVATNDGRPAAPIACDEAASALIQKFLINP
jgi:CubicO group peptidase (beta-lactamase class C family)